ncbi:zinc dependent phospholipase C family protein [Desulforamulus aquiferis]|nr:zinc dependent phospholipase C family protein [Desulforamulus aquiferis]
MLNFVMSLRNLSVSSYTKAHLPQLPTQIVLGAGATHLFCNLQAIEILRNDNHLRAANLFSHFINQLEAGVIWADKGFKSLSHHYHPETSSGKWHWFNASTVFEEYFEQAISHWKSKKHEGAMFYLGAASHLLQDMCVPHHSRCVILDGHQEYEHWAEEHRNEYRVYEKGLYQKMTCPRDWIHHNASCSFNFFHLVKAGISEESYHQATQALLPLAQQSTSGFWLYFYEMILE